MLPPKGSFFALSLLIPLCSAVTFPGPVITPAPKVAFRQFEGHLGKQRARKPFEEFAITVAPLIRRQDTTTAGFRAPDNTCGYVDGRLGAPEACGLGLTCVAVYNPLSTDIGMIGCCSSMGGSNVNCAAQFTCINSADMSARCDEGCREDVNTVKCTNVFSPYCYPFVFSQFNSATLWDCRSSSYTGSGGVRIDTTYDGDTTAGTNLWVAVTGIVGSSIASIDSSASGGGFINPASSSPPTGTAPSVHTTSSTSPPTPPPTKLPIGAIVGGVVGGVIGLAIVGLIAFYIHRKTRNNDREVAPQPPSAPPTRLHSPPPPLSPPTAVSDFFGNDRPKSEDGNLDTMRSHTTVTSVTPSANSPTEVNRNPSENFYPSVPQPGAGNLGGTAHEMP